MKKTDILKVSGVMTLMCAVPLSSVYAQWPTFDVEKVTTTIDTYMSEAEGVVAKVSATQAVTEVTQAIGDNVNSLTSFTDDVKEKAAKLEEKKQKLEKRAERLKKLKAKYEQYKKKVQEYAAYAKEGIETAKALKAKAENIKSQIEDVTAQATSAVNTAKSYATSATSAVSSATSAVSSATSAVSSATSAVSSATSAVSNSTSELSNLTGFGSSSSSSNSSKVSVSASSDNSSEISSSLIGTLTGNIDVSTSMPILSLTSDASAREESDDADFSRDTWSNEAETGNEDDASEAMATTLRRSFGRKESAQSEKSSDDTTSLTTSDEGAATSATLTSADSATQKLNSSVSDVVNKASSVSTDASKTDTLRQPFGNTLNSVISKTQQKLSTSENAPEGVTGELRSSLSWSEAVSFAQEVSLSGFKTGTLSNGKFVFSDQIAQNCQIGWTGGIGEDESSVTISEDDINKCLQIWIEGLTSDSQTDLNEWLKNYKEALNDHRAADLQKALENKQYAASFETEVSDKTQAKGSTLSTERAEIGFASAIAQNTQDVIVRMLTLMSSRLITESFAEVQHMDKDYLTTLKGDE